MLVGDFLEVIEDTPWYKVGAILKIKSFQDSNSFVGIFDWPDQQYDHREGSPVDRWCVRTQQVRPKRFTLKEIIEGFYSGYLNECQIQRILQLQPELQNRFIHAESWPRESQDPWILG